MNKKTIGETISENKVYLIVNDDQKMIWLYKGLDASIKLQFIGCLVQKQLKLQLRGFYGTKDFNLPKDSELYQKIMSSKSGSGRAKEILRTDVDVKKEEQISKTQDTVDKSRVKETSVHRDVISKIVIPDILELENPQGFHRNMTFIGGSAYSEEIVIDKFITEDKKKKNLRFLGKLPNGFFFIEDISSRIIIKKGTVQALDFMVNNDQFLGTKKIMVPVLLKDKFSREGDINVLIKNFSNPEETTVEKKENEPDKETESDLKEESKSDQNSEIEEDKTLEKPE
ncbi:MAG: hypothetical protein GY870_10805 [archaeon]|nr:hypothetical protein [archaeon]